MKEQTDTSIFREGPHAGEKIKDVHQAYDHASVLGKLRYIAEGDEKIREAFNRGLKDGMNLNDFPNILAFISEKNLKEISSLIGDIRYHTTNGGKDYDPTEDIQKILDIINKPTE